jgi:multicomponent Na+:H+ antiporter subunit F
MTFPLDWLVDTMMFLMSIGMALCIIRLMRGPSIADRAVALDQIAVGVVAIVLLYSIRVNDPVYLDAAMVVALIGFLGTLAFARYIERGAKL